MAQSPQTTVPASIADSGRIRVGAGLRLVSVSPVGSGAPQSAVGPQFAPTAVVDAGRVRVGAGLKRLPASVADTGRVRVGAGLKRA